MINITKKQQKILQYLKHDIRNISKGNESFIKFFFPESPIFFDYIPSFCDDNVPMFLLDPTKDKGKKTLMNMIPNLVVLFNSTRNTIDSKKGFLTILTDAIGMKISEGLLKALNEFEDDDYWFTLKTWYALDEVLEFETGQQSWDILNLFKSLFVYDFGTLYKFYKNSGDPYQKVFSTLLTMMSTAKNLESYKGTSENYKKTLMHHNNYVPVFKKALYNYTQTPVSELDFLNFLHECSSSYLQRQ